MAKWKRNKNPLSFRALRRRELVLLIKSEEIPVLQLKGEEKIARNYPAELSQLFRTSHYHIVGRGRYMISPLFSAYRICITLLHTKKKQPDDIRHRQVLSYEIELFNIIKHWNIPSNDKVIILRNGFMSLDSDSYIVLLRAIFPSESSVFYT